jgi:hypothetical protein
MACSNSDAAARLLANNTLALKGIWVDVVANNGFHPDSHHEYSDWLESAHDSQEGVDLLREEFEGTIAGGRLLFDTCSGMRVIGPSSIHVGDCIFVLAGGKLPFTLRQSGQKQYQLVGECYVQGLMSGAATEPGCQSMRRRHPVLSLQESSHVVPEQNWEDVYLI